MTTASMPTWVPALLAGLLFLGWRQSQPGTVRPRALMIIALVMAGLSVRSVLGGLGAQPLVLLAWLASYAAALRAGARHFTAQGLTATGRGVQVPGSWMPMVLILGIFGTNTAVGVATALHSPLLAQPAVATALAVLIGLFGGGLGGRALAVWRCATAARSLPLAVA